MLLALLTKRKNVLESVQLKYLERSWEAHGSSVYMDSVSRLEPEWPQTMFQRAMNVLRREPSKTVETQKQT